MKLKVLVLLVILTLLGSFTISAFAQERDGGEGAVFYDSYLVGVGIGFANQSCEILWPFDPDSNNFVRYTEDNQVRFEHIASTGNMYVYDSELGYLSGTGRININDTYDFVNNVYEFNLHWRGKLVDADGNRHQVNCFWTSDGTSIEINN